MNRIKAINFEITKKLRIISTAEIAISYIGENSLIRFRI